MKPLSLKYKLIGATALLSLLLSFYFYTTNKVENLERKVEDQETTIIIKEDEIKVEVLEEKWETIAAEHNKSKEILHYEEPIKNHDTNVTTFTFFKWMPRED